MHTAYEQDTKQEKFGNLACRHINKAGASTVRLMGCTSDGDGKNIDVA